MRRNLQYLTITVLFCLALSILCAALCAQSFSQILSFQGRLADSGTGKPLADGQYQVTFKIYDAASDGSNLWQETQTVDQEGGVFSVHLGSVTQFPSDLFSNGDRWLALQVSGDDEMTERYQFTPSPWAIYAGSSGTDNDWAFSGNDIYRLSGNVGIGTNSPGRSLQVGSRYMDSDGIIRAAHKVGGSYREWDFGVGDGTFFGHDDNFGFRDMSGEGHTIMVLQSNGQGGNVGINTETPGERLEVQGNARIVGDYIQVGNVQDLHGADRLRMAHYYPTYICDTNGTERITVLTDGKVGIWTNGPKNEFDVKGAIAVGDDAFRAAAPSYGMIMQGRVGLGTASPSSSYQLHVNGAIGVNGHLYGTAAAGFSVATTQGHLVLGPTTNKQVRVGWPDTTRELYVSGNTGIGIETPAQKLDVNGKVRIRDWYTTGAYYDVQAQSDGDLVVTGLSSRRYKKDIRDLEANPGDVLDLRPVSFRWKETGEEDVGLVAEEVDDVIKGLVVYDEQGRPDAVRYDKLSLYMLAAMKELKRENEALRQRIKVLESEAADG